ncbi:MAG: hypothetical protein AAGC55_29740, partial [Myxococcota bacterium]
MSDNSNQAQAQELLHRGLELYRQSELLAALSEWEMALALDPACHEAQKWIDFVQDNFDLPSEQFNLNDAGQPPSVDTSFDLESLGSGAGELDPNALIIPPALRSLAGHADRSTGPSQAVGEPGDQSSKPDGWPLGMRGDPVAPALPSAALASPAGKSSGDDVDDDEPTQSLPGRSPSRKLDPAKLAEVLPRPEDDDLLKLANDTTTLPFDLSGSAAAAKEPERRPTKRGLGDPSAAPAG